MSASAGPGPVAQLAQLRRKARQGKARRGEALIAVRRFAKDSAVAELDGTSTSYSSPHKSLSSRASSLLVPYFACSPSVRSSYFVSLSPTWHSRLETARQGCSSFGSWRTFSHFGEQIAGGAGINLETHGGGRLFPGGFIDDRVQDKRWAGHFNQSRLARRIELQIARRMRLAPP